MKLVLASKNKGKLVEMQTILAELGVEVVLQADLGINDTQSVYFPTSI